METRTSWFSLSDQNKTIGPHRHQLPQLGNTPLWADSEDWRLDVAPCLIAQCVLHPWSSAQTQEIRHLSQCPHQRRRWHIKALTHFPCSQTGLATKQDFDAEREFFYLRACHPYIPIWPRKRLFGDLLFDLLLQSDFIALIKNLATHTLSLFISIKDLCACASRWHRSSCDFLGSECASSLIGICQCFALSSCCVRDRTANHPSRKSASNQGTLRGLITLSPKPPPECAGSPPS